MGITAYFACGFTSRAEHREYIHAAGRRHCGTLLFTHLIFAFADDVLWPGSAARDRIVAVYPLLPVGRDV